MYYRQNNSSRVTESIRYLQKHTSIVDEQKIHQYRISDKWCENTLVKVSTFCKTFQVY